MAIAFFKWLWGARAKPTKRYTYTMRCEDIIPPVCESVRRARERGTLLRVEVDMRHVNGQVDSQLDAIVDAAGARKLVLVC